MRRRDASSAAPKRVGRRNAATSARSSSAANLAPSPWLPQDKRGAERELKREAVLRVAAQLFDQRGFAATSVDDISARLNVTKATIYHYFENKEDVLFQCVRAGLNAFIEMAEGALASEGAASIRLEMLLRGYGKTVLSVYGGCVLKTTAFELSAKNWTVLMDLKNKIGDCFREVIANGGADGSLCINSQDPSSQEVSVAMYTMIGALNWLTTWFKPSGKLSPEQMIEQIVNRIMVGMAARPR